MSLSFEKLTELQLIAIATGLSGLKDRNTLLIQGYQEELTRIEEQLVLFSARKDELTDLIKKVEDDVGLIGLVLK